VRLPSKHFLKAVSANLLVIIAGALLIALSLNVLLIPYGLLTGGVSGLALIIFYLFKIPVFASIIVFNIPIFLWGAKEINLQFFMYSLAGTLALAALLPATEGWVPVPQVDLLMAAIFGGILSGAGLGLVFRGHGSTGGSDIVAVILRKKKNLGLGEVSFYSNLLVVGISMIFFPVNTGLYSIISMFAAGKFTDVIITGLNINKSVVIISDRSFLIGKRIMDEMRRGVTYFEGTGAYTSEKKAVINCVVSRFELAMLKSIVAETDPGAFMYISDASEVLGKGFSAPK